MREIPQRLINVDELELITGSDVQKLVLFRKSLYLFCKIMTVVVLRMKRDEEMEDIGTHGYL